MYSHPRKIISKKNIVIGILLCLSVIVISATYLPKEQPINLKVLPKNISDKELDKIMVEDCGDGLGVTCDHCHVEDKTTKKFDYASDAREQKDTARSMMRMTMELNKNFFGRTNPIIGDSTMPVTCFTCHHGYPEPKEKK